MFFLKNLLKKKFYFLLLLAQAILVIFMATACSSYDNKFDVVYFFKTEPEKAVLDFLQSLDNKDPDYIYTNLLPDKDRNNISREKYVEDFKKILSEVDQINIISTVYLGYEDDMSKVVAEFEIIYKNGEAKQYKKYIYLTEESGKWKIIFEKTFI